MGCSVPGTVAGLEAIIGAGQMHWHARVRSLGEAYTVPCSLLSLMYSLTVSYMHIMHSDVMAQWVECQLSTPKDLGLIPQYLLNLGSGIPACHPSR